MERLHRLRLDLACAVQSSVPGRLALVLSLLLLLSGCRLGESPHIPPVISNPVPLSCDIFTQTRWQEFRFGVDSPDDVAAKATSLWGIEQDQLFLSSSYQWDLTLGWSSSISGRDVHYEAWFGEDRHLLGIEASWRHPFATLSQVLDCLGPPDLYSARFEADHEAQLNLNLWYVEKGFSFRHYSYPRAQRYQTVWPGQRIDNFSVTAPLPLSQAYPDPYTAGDDPALSASAMCPMKPWPGSIEAIELTWYDDDSRCRIPPRISW